MLNTQKTIMYSDINFLIFPVTELPKAEVSQNYNALRGRYGL
jgi:hypothetical protein